MLRWRLTRSASPMKHLRASDRSDISGAAKISRLAEKLAPRHVFLNLHSGSSSLLLSILSPIAGCYPIFPTRWLSGVLLFYVPVLVLYDI